MQWIDRSFVIGGTRLAARSGRVGERPAPYTLVFLHDSLGCITTWRTVPEVFGHALNCDVLLYDRQGYGRSDPFGPEPRDAGYLHLEADVLHAVLTAAGIEQAVLFGHSDGGTIALLAAARHPDRVAAVVTEGAHVLVEEVTLNGIRATERMFHTTDLRERLVRHHGERTDALFQAWADTWQAPFFRGWDITSELAGINCPVLVLQGVDDQFGTEAQVQAIAASTGANVRTYMVPGAGHSPHKDAPGITLDLVLQFVRSI
jgi:pimeloyl-ACP methyl ester carboxylesterase